MTFSFKNPLVIGPSGMTDTGTDLRDIVTSRLNLFLNTQKGDRVFRPGCGILISDMIGLPISAELVTAIQTVLKSDITTYFADQLEINSMTVSTEETVLVIEIEFRIKENNEIVNERFSRNI